MKRTPLRRVSPNKKSSRAQKMQLKKDVIEQYQLPNIECKRWGTAKKPSRTDILRGMLWTVFSMYIRLRDAGTCISCGRTKTFLELQAGHFVPVGGNDVELCFDEKNVNGECAACNADFDGWHLIPMRKNLVAKYGEDEVCELENRKAQKRAIKWEEKEYVDRIKHYYGLIHTQA